MINWLLFGVLFLWLLRVVRAWQEKQTHEEFKREVRRVCERLDYDRDAIVDYLMKEFPNGKGWEWVCNWITAIPDASLYCGVFEGVEQRIHEQESIDEAVEPARE